METCWGLEIARSKARSLWKFPETKRWVEAHSLDLHRQWPFREREEGQEDTGKRSPGTGHSRAGAEEFMVGVELHLWRLHTGFWPLLRSSSASLDGVTAPPLGPGAERAGLAVQGSRAPAHQARGAWTPPAGPTGPGGRGPASKLLPTVGQVRGGPSPNEEACCWGSSGGRGPDTGGNQVLPASSAAPHVPLSLAV